MEHMDEVALMMKGFPPAPNVGAAHPGTFGAEIGSNLRRYGIVPDLTGVSVTMLWSLHNRASEAKRPDSILDDPDSIYVQSAMTLRTISAILWARSRDGWPKLTRRCGGGSNAIRRGSSYRSGKGSNPISPS
jgi:hypothetical protein